MRSGWHQRQAASGANLRVSASGLVGALAGDGCGRVGEVRPRRTSPLRSARRYCDPVNDAIQSLVNELVADSGVRGVLLFGSHARGNARPDSDADLAIFVEQDGFVMGCSERDGQEFELIRLSEAAAIGYFTDNRDAAADVWQVAKILYDPDGVIARVRDHVLGLLAEGKPPMDAARIEWSRFAAADRFSAAAGLALRNQAAARMVLHERVLELTATFFDVRQLWAPPMKRRLEAIGDINPELYGLLERIFGPDVSVDEQVQLARLTLPLVYEKRSA